jgi:hypothetical protein
LNDETTELLIWQSLYDKGSVEKRSSVDDHDLAILFASFANTSPSKVVTSVTDLAFRDS